MYWYFANLELSQQWQREFARCCPKKCVCVLSNISCSFRDYKMNFTKLKSSHYDNLTMISLVGPLTFRLRPTYNNCCENNLYIHDSVAIQMNKTKNQKTRQSHGVPRFPWFGLKAYIHRSTVRNSLWIWFKRYMLSQTWSPNTTRKLLCYFPSIP